jgi:hypothetical protein
MRSHTDHTGGPDRPRPDSDVPAPVRQADGRHQVTAPCVEAQDKPTAAVPAANPDTALANGDACDPVARLLYASRPTDYCSTMRKRLRRALPTRYIPAATSATHPDGGGHQPSDSKSAQTTATTRRPTEVPRTKPDKQLAAAPVEEAGVAVHADHALAADERGGASRRWIGPLVAPASLLEQASRRNWFRR